jgi:hypothetical protein
MARVNTVVLIVCITLIVIVWRMTSPRKHIVLPHPSRRGSSAAASKASPPQVCRVERKEPPQCPACPSKVSVEGLWV